jgi:hypothetical protein
MGDKQRQMQDFENTVLDPIRQLYKNAEEEYTQYLKEYEELFGESAREEYEEKWGMV